MGTSSALTPVDSQADLPRSIRRGPKITVACACGEKRYLQYGEQWACECGRTWNTRRIPLEEYARLRRTQLRYRRVPLIIATLSLVCVVAFIVVGRALAGVLLVGFVATSWSMFGQPFYKRRYREQLAKVPSWELEPE
jgi:hypothetical protein